MKRFKTILIIAMVAVLLVPALSFSAEKKKGIHIGLSMPFINAPYFKVWIETFKKTCDDAGVQFTMTDAGADLNTQIGQIENLISKGIDGLVVVPLDAKGIVPAIKSAAKSKTPIITSNVMTDPQQLPELVCFTGPDSYLEGKIAGEETVKLFEKTGKKVVNAVEITGVPGYSAAIDRANGWRDKIKELKGEKFVNVLGSQPGNWQKADAQTAMENMITSFGKKIDLVYAHDDTMAVGAWNALKAAGYSKGKPIIFGIGGSREGLAAIKSGEMKLTVLQSPSFDGRLSASTMIDIVNGKKPAEFFVFQELPVVTIDNVDQYLPGEW
jgi:ribose transport system substrate-binding protein